MLAELHRFIVDKMLTGVKSSGGYWSSLVRMNAALLHTPGATVELGCGNGLFLEALRDRESPITGVDVSEGNLSCAQEVLADYRNVTLLQMDATNTGIEGESFDNCYCINVFINAPHIDIVRSFAREAHRLLKPGGLYTFDVRNASCLFLRFQYLYARIIGIELVLQAYYLADMRALLAETGFRVRRVLYVGLPGRFLAPDIIILAEKI